MFLSLLASGVPTCLLRESILIPSSSITCLHQHLAKLRSVVKVTHKLFGVVCSPALRKCSLPLNTCFIWARTKFVQAPIFILILVTANYGLANTARFWLAKIYQLPCLKRHEILIILYRTKQCNAIITSYRSICIYI
jgi:hypothetical protein